MTSTKMDGSYEFELAIVDCIASTSASILADVISARVTVLMEKLWVFML